jgi:hypothetical protein
MAIVEPGAVDDAARRARSAAEDGGRATFLAREEWALAQGKKVERPPLRLRRPRQSRPSARSGHKRGGVGRGHWTARTRRRGGHRLPRSRGRIVRSAIGCSGVQTGGCVPGPPGLTALPLPRTRLVPSRVVAAPGPWTGRASRNCHSRAKRRPSPTPRCEVHPEAEERGRLLPVLPQQVGGAGPGMLLARLSGGRSRAAAVTGGGSSARRQHRLPHSAGAASRIPLRVSAGRGEAENGVMPGPRRRGGGGEGERQTQDGRADDQIGSGRGRPGLKSRWVAGPESGFRVPSRQGDDRFRSRTGHIRGYAEVGITMIMIPERLCAATTATDPAATPGRQKSDGR